MSESLMTAYIDLKVDKTSITSAMSGIGPEVAAAGKKIEQNFTNAGKKIEQNFTKITRNFKTISNAAVMMGMQVEFALKMVAAPMAAMAVKSIHSALKDTSDSTAKLRWEWNQYLISIRNSQVQIGQWAMQSKVYGKSLIDWVGVFADKLKKVTANDVQKFINALKTITTMIGVVRFGTILLKLSDGTLTILEKLIASNVASNLGGGALGTIGGGAAGSASTRIIMSRAAAREAGIPLMGTAGRVGVVIPPTPAASAPFWNLTFGTVTASLVALASTLLAVTTAAKAVNGTLDENTTKWGTLLEGLTGLFDGLVWVYTASLAKLGGDIGVLINQLIVGGKSIFSNKPNPELLTADQRMDAANPWKITPLDKPKDKGLLFDPEFWQDFYDKGMERGDFHQSGITAEEKYAWEDKRKEALAESREKLAKEFNDIIEKENDFKEIMKGFKAQIKELKLDQFQSARQLSVKIRDAKMEMNKPLGYTGSYVGGGEEFNKFAQSVQNDHIKRKEAIDEKIADLLVQDVATNGQTVEAIKKLTEEMRNYNIRNNLNLNNQNPEFGMGAFSEP